LADLLSGSPVIPVVAIKSAKHGVKLAETLLDNGVNAIEITLRTEAALDAIKTIKKACPNMIMGVGTVLTPQDVTDSVNIGADFLVSPGMSPKLEDAMLKSGLLSLPGIATPSEALTRYEAGFEMVKLFPAAVVGGVPMLKGMYAPMPHLRFMPTGGVRLSNMMDYLELPNVVSVGGTWIAPQADIENENWDKIAQNCQDALALTRA